MNLQPDRRFPLPPWPVSRGGRWRTFWIVAASLALVLVIGVVDYVTGLDVSVS